MILTRELLAKAEAISIPSRRKGRHYQRGERTALKKGASLEFSDYREYLQGDDLRSIDWSVYARSERLFLKLFLEEQSKPVYFVIDGSESMKFGEPSKFEFARSFSALLSYACLRHYDHPHILIVREDRFQSFPIRSRKEFFSLLPRIEKELCRGEIRWDAALRRILYSRNQRGVYFVLSDFYSSHGFDGIKTLAALGNDVHCLQILSAEEFDPSLRGDLRLLDCETSDHSEVSITAGMLKKYRKALADLQQQIRGIANSAGGSFYSISSNSTLGEVVFQKLRAAGVLA
jgi:uncharacterized protein (DUF58 family)